VHGERALKSPAWEKGNRDQGQGVRT